MMGRDLLGCAECGALSEPTEREMEEYDGSLELLSAMHDERRRALERIRAVAGERGASEEWCIRVLSAMFGEAA